MDATQAIAHSSRTKAGFLCMISVATVPPLTPNKVHNISFTLTNNYNRCYYNYINLQDEKRKKYNDYLQDLWRLRLRL